MTKRVAIFIAIIAAATALSDVVAEEPKKHTTTNGAPPTQGTGVITSDSCEAFGPLPTDLKAAEEPKPKYTAHADGTVSVEMPTPIPTISLELRARFWRFAAEHNAIKPAWDKVDAAFKAVQAEIQQACGKHQAVFDAKGEPTCQARPPEPKKSETEKEK